MKMPNKLTKIWWFIQDYYLTGIEFSGLIVVILGVILNSLWVTILGNVIYFVGYYENKVRDLNDEILLLNDEIKALENEAR